MSYLIYRPLLATNRRAGWECQSCSYASRSKRAKQALITPARTRFAPSPTGHLHLGSLRTALFNYLIAKNTGGQFLLRLEDTDQKRTVKGAEEGLYEILQWTGLHFDEGPVVGGPYAPYRQSERADIHKRHADILLKNGHAYRCFCSKERLRELAMRRGQIGQAQDYDRMCESIPVQASKNKAAAGEPFVVRLRAPEEYPVVYDVLFGEVKYGQTAFKHGEPSFEDPILMKTDGLPTYHLANVVDDHLMKITHVIRGLEWMPSTPKHVYMYQAFGWTPPTFVHVGLLQNEDGTKLSKRTGDVTVSAYREKGYLPEALVNFVVLMGWHNKDTSDIFTLDELIKKFSMADMSVGNTIVSLSKLDYLQKAHVGKLFASRHQHPEAYDAMMDIFASSIAKHIQSLSTSQTPQFAYIRDCLESDIKNLTTPSTFFDEHLYYFVQELDYHTPRAVAMRETWSEEEAIAGRTFLDKLANTLADMPADTLWNVQTLKSRIKPVNLEIFPGQLKLPFVFLRYALTGVESGPSIYDIMRMFGKERCIQALKNVRLYYTEEEEAKLLSDTERENLVL